jgi:hypothetical protein
LYRTSFLEQDCDPEAEALTGESPIKHFYCYGELSMIKLCVKYKKHDPRTWKSHIRPFPSLNLHNNTKQDSLYHTQSSTFVNISPLDLACSKDGSLDVVKFLVEEYDLDPLERAKVIGSDDTEGVLRLFEVDTVLPSADDVMTKLKSACRRTPLTQACKSGRLDLLQYLISKCGSSVSHHYHLLMSIACDFGYIEIMTFLLKIQHSRY